MRIFKKLLWSFLALLISTGILYTDILLAFPGEIAMFCNQLHQKNLGAGVIIGDIPQSAQAVSGENTVTPKRIGEYDASLKIGGKIPFRKVKLKITKPQEIYVSGELVGLKIYNDGLIVTNTEPITCNGIKLFPAQNAGILPGDVIVEINQRKPKRSDNVSSLLSEKTVLKLIRNGKEKFCEICPVKDDNDGALKMGIWVRDSTAGVGTLTYYEPENLTYGALGHGISDSDTGTSFDVESGTIEKSSVVSLTKGKKGSPGQIYGSFSSEQEIEGTILKNCSSGIFGDIFPHSSLEGRLYPIGLISQVRTGKASILSKVDESIKEYEIKILRTMPYQSATKGLAIEITDSKLLEKTGGIVQGMSGSPIIQNGRIVGAVTHVLVNDPTRGYGIFIENMLSEAKEIG